MDSVAPVSPAATRGPTVLPRRSNSPKDLSAFGQPAPQSYAMSSSSAQSGQAVRISPTPKEAAQSGLRHCWRATGWLGAVMGGSYAAGRTRPGMLG